MSSAHDELVKIVEDLPGVEVFWLSIPESFRQLTLEEARENRNELYLNASKDE